VTNPGHPELGSGSAFSASSNADTLTFTASGEATITSDILNKTLTVNVPDFPAPDYTLSGWTHGTGVVYPTTLTDMVGIGTANPTHALDVVGTANVSGAVNLGSSLNVTGATAFNAALAVTGSATISSLDLNLGGITNAGVIDGATGFTSSGTVKFTSLGLGVLHSDLNGVLSSSPVDLTDGDVSGILPVTHGGTGLTAFNAGDIPFASSTNT